MERDESVVENNCLDKINPTFYKIISIISGER